MKKRFIIALFVCFGMAGSSMAGELNIIVDLTPAAILYSPDAKGFRFSDGNTVGEMDKAISMDAGVKAGIGLNLDSIIADITGGIGYYYNSAFTARAVMADIAIRYKIVREEFTVGPHVSVIAFKPNWKGETHITLANETGILAGIGLTIGSKTVSFISSIDYLSASFDIEPPGFSLEGDSLDISGVMLQLGVLLRF